jgi:hypothetical protein
VYIPRLQRQRLRLWFEAYDAIYDMVKAARGGMAWMAFLIWAPGRLVKVQCNFSAVISSAMFHEYVVPYLTQQCDQLDALLSFSHQTVCNGRRALPMPMAAIRAGISSSAGSSIPLSSCMQ